MFQPDQYMSSLIHQLKAAFQQRLIFVGLQAAICGEKPRNTAIST